MKISTNRLDLIAASLDHIQAELESPQRLAALLGAGIEPGWPPGEYDRGAQEFFRDRLVEDPAAALGWYIWYAVLRGSEHQPSMVVGAGGYFGPPGVNGEVEIGFSVMPARQGQGYATEMAGALIQRAFTDLRVPKVVAQTTAGNPASRRVLEKCGFSCVGEDENSGSIRFEIQGSL